MKGLRKAAFGLGGSLLLLTAGWVFRTPLLTGAGRWLNVGQPPAQVTYIVPLPGGPQTRPFVAAAWLRSRLADQALVVQTRVTPDVAKGLELTSSDLTKAVFAAYGVERDRIVDLETASDSTADDAAGVAAFLDQHPQGKVAIVTNDFHTRRARWTFATTMPRHFDRLIFISAPVDGIRADNWWHWREGWTLYLSEYFKLAAYWFWYGSGLYWLAGMTLVFMACWLRFKYGRTAQPPSEPQPATVPISTAAKAAATCASGPAPQSGSLFG